LQKFIYHVITGIRDPLNFLCREDYRKPDFNISVIADVSCDIKKPIASTLRASTIDQPFYGYDPETGTEGDPFDMKNITVMAVDNLPGELPRDASEDFADKLVESVFPAFLNDRDAVIERATIVREGGLTKNFSYLEDFLSGKGCGWLLPPQFRNSLSVIIPSRLIAADMPVPILSY
jgi:saccharopine dehydrogenase (NAD+, L-lysine forming)